MSDRFIPAILISLIIALIQPTQPTALAQDTSIVPGTSGIDLPEPPTPEPSFTLAILPDRTTGRPWGMPYLERAVKEINLIGPDAVFTIGDMVQGYTRSVDRYEQEVAEYLGIVNQLDAPFYPLPGNHDVISGFRNPDDHRFEDIYKQRFGPLYYAVFLDHLTVISLFTDEHLQSQPRFSETQYEWLHERIDEAIDRGNPLVVMMHKPMWRYRRANWSEAHEHLAKAAESGLNTIVIAGHFHSLQRDPDRDGVQYHLVGTCGALIDQHPLGGQLQHFTILKANASGDVRIYHHPLGCTLADDFIHAEDQDRVHDLRSAGKRYRFENLLNQPYRHPVSGTVLLNVKNPIDVPITIQTRLGHTNPQKTPIAGYGFYGETLIDTFNPFVTNIETPVSLEHPIEQLVLQPGEEGHISIPLRCTAQPKMLPPPPIELTATFTDNHGRTVPVYIHKRMPLSMHYTVTNSHALDMPISAWKFSVYDRKERDPEMGLSISENQLMIALVVYDQDPCFEPDRTPDERINDPISDAIRITFGAVEDRLTYLIEPLDPEPRTWQAVHHEHAPSDSPDESWVLEPVPDIQWSRIDTEDGFGLIIQIPLNLIGGAGREIPFNLEVADNDLTYHTQWRQWSAPEAGSTIILPRQF